jgi:dipeptidyl aminopeptidase/acylaminoacyl peptidase
MNHASEIYSFDLKKNTWKQITNVNTATYDSLALSKTEEGVTTTDGKKMLVWVILPQILMRRKVSNTFILPRRTTKRLTQFYSFRWNFQLMAANGYIVVAPNRRGMPGHGWSGMNKSVKTGADR